MIRKGLLALASVALAGGILSAQRVALRTNLLALATGNINIEGSVMLSGNVSLHLPLQAKPFAYPLPLPVGVLHYAEGEGSSQILREFGTVKRTENFTIQPGLRYWMRGVYNRGVFIGAYAIGSWFKWGEDKLDPNYKQGYGLGAGLSIGYNYELSKRWNLEAEVGLGGLWRTYDRVHAQTQSAYQSNKDIILTMPRLGISLTYLLK